MLALIYQGLQANPENIRTTGIVLGLVLLLGHLLALFQPAKAMALAKKFPRHRLSGYILLGIAAFWSWGLLHSKGLDLGLFKIPGMILGEFSWVRTPLLWAMPVLFYLVSQYADEFLSVRALGCVMFLLASLLLDIVWLHFDIHATRQLIPLYCYLVLILPAMLLVGQPWRLRDLIDWFGRKPAAWRGALATGAAFGALVLTSAILWW